MPYVPPPNPTGWERAAPEGAGLDPLRSLSQRDMLPSTRPRGAAIWLMP